MQLSIRARKAAATALAASTILWSAAGIVPQIASAAVHSEGCLVLSGGIVWMITNGTRRGYTSAEVFQSYGYNFSQVVTATAEDVALPVGPIMIYADGTLVKGPNDPLVYLVASGQKRPFVSGAVFTGLGYSFANIQSAPVNTFSDLPTGANLDSTTIAHPAGTKVISNGAVWMMTATGRMGFPSAANFLSYGYKFAHVVSANSYDLALANEGVVPARAACTGGGGPTLPPQPVSGSVNVSLSGPAASTLIIDSVDAGNYTSQSLAPLANFVFTGSGTVTSLTLARTGVSTDAMISNLYLFDGATRLTDAASFSSGNLTISNPNGLFSISNGVRTITVRADLDDGAYSGQTVGVNLTAVTLSSGTVAGLPVVGPVHGSANATLATVDVGAVTDSGATAPGPDITVWQATFTVGTRDVNFTRMALRQINNIVNSDVQNFRLLVDGVQVAQTQNIDSNGYVTFSGFSKVLKTAPIVRVIADVIGGSSRTLEMSMRNRADYDLVDSQYNVNIAAFDVFPADSDGVAISAGSVTTARATDSPSGNVINNASFVKLGKWTLTAYGEPIKIENLSVAIDTSGTDGDYDLRNGKLYVNGAQIGSTASLVAAGATTAAKNFTTNFTLTPGTPATVELYSDIYDEDTTGAELVAGDTITAYLVDDDLSNATPQVSLTPIDVPTGADFVANVLTVATGAMTLAKDNAYGNQNVVVPASVFKIGDFALTGSSSEDITLSTFEVRLDVADDVVAADLSSLYVKYGSKTTSVTSSPGTGASTSTWSISETLAKNTSMDIEVYVDISSGAVATETVADTVIPSLLVSGTTVSSGTAVSTNGGVVLAGQTITAKLTGALTVSVDSGTPVASQQVAGMQQADGSLKIKLAGTNEDLYVRAITVRVDTDADDAGLTSLALFSSLTSSGYTPKGTTQAWNNDAANPGYVTFTLTGSDRVTVPKNGSAYMLFKPTYVSSDQGAVSGLTPALSVLDMDADGSTALAASGTGGTLINASGIIVQSNASATYVDSVENNTAADMTAAATTLVTANTVVFTTGDIIFIDENADATWDPATEELMSVVLDGGANLTVTRGVFGTTAVAYAADTMNIYRLDNASTTRGLTGNAQTLLKTKLSLAAASDSPAGATTGGTQKVIAKLVATAASNGADPATNEARIDWMDITTTESAATVTNLALYPAGFDQNATYGAACGGISTTVWRCTLATAGDTNKVTEGTSTTFVARADVGFSGAGSVDVSIASLGTSDAAANDVNWNDGTTDITWVNQAVTSLVLNSSALSTTAASGTADTTAPTISTTAGSFAFGGTADNALDAGDTITITFTEEIDASDISASLVPGGAAVTPAEGAVGDVSIAITTGIVTIVSIATTDVDGGDPGAATYTNTVALNTAGTVLTITLTTLDSGSAALSGAEVFGDVTGLTVITDVSGVAQADSAITATGNI